LVDGLLADNGTIVPLSVKSAFENKLAIDRARTKLWNSGADAFARGRLLALIGERLRGSVGNQRFRDRRHSGEGRARLTSIAPSTMEPV
jgi:hypothetical protein